MKKILIFIVGMLSFAGGVKADVPPYVDFWFSKKIVSVDEQVLFEFNNFNNNTGNYTVKYDEEYLEYVDAFCSDGDGEPGGGCVTECEIDTQKLGEITFSCNNKLADEEVLAVEFRTIKDTEGEETFIFESFDGYGAELSFEIVDIKEYKNDKKDFTDSIACKNVEQRSNFEFLTEPFVLGIIAGFSIVVVILSVMLSKKNKQLKNVQK